MSLVGETKSKKQKVIRKKQLAKAKKYFLFVNSKTLILQQYSMKKLWQKKIETNSFIEQFTTGDDPMLDLELAPFDVLGSLAHIQMLNSVGLLGAEEYEILTENLRAIYKTIAADKFEIEDGIEDVHSQIELQLTQTLGDVGKRIHAARSRNDQVLVDLKLFYRAQLEKILNATQTLFETYLTQSEKYKEVVLPGYTHTQIAMPSSFGLWFGAYAETLCDDAHFLLAAYNVVNQNPLGSAAGYGSSLPIDRTLTTKLLGFADMNYNVVHAQMGRGKAEYSVAVAIATIATTLSRCSADACLFINQNFDFISLPDTLTTGSSIMPHKKNPDVFEILRAKCNQLITTPAQVSSLTTNLISGYHRDYQLLKEIIFPALHTLTDCLAMMEFMIARIEVKQNITERPLYDTLFTVEAVNDLVQKGMPFREAYHTVSQQLADGTYTPNRELNHTHAGSIGMLCTDEIKNKFQQIYAQFPFNKVHAAEKNLING